MKERIMNENQDLLDLSRLNIMEDNIKDSPAPDKDETLKAIDWKKQRLVEKIKPGDIAPDAMEKHIKANTRDGIYPWTDAMEVIWDDEIE